ncbi:CSC1-like protein 1 [Rhinophrynus dorsalis]
MFNLTLGLASTLQLMLLVNQSLDNHTICYNGPLGGEDHQSLFFGGVPEAFMLYTIGFVVLLVIFAAIRKRFWDYGRIAMVVTDSDTVPPTIDDSGFWTWLKNTFHMTDSVIQERCGEDAIHYFSFQRHMICLLAIVSILSVGVILPVNLNGKLQGSDPYNFGRTTIANLQRGDNLLWLHIVTCLIILITTVAFLRRHTSSIHYKDEYTVKQTLFITGLPTDITEETIRLHFSEDYPSCQVLGVHLCYDVADLIRLSKEIKKAEKNLAYYTKQFNATRERAFINPNPCGQLCWCTVHICDPEDAIMYYSAVKEKLEKKYASKQKVVRNVSLGSAFVTFATQSMATAILKDFNTRKGQVCRCASESQQSAHSTQLNTLKWTVRHATCPEDIYWENLSTQGVRWWARFLAINICLFIVLFFLTTPTMFLEIADKLKITDAIYQHNSSVVRKMFPTLVLWIFSLILPTIVYYSTLFEAHWTKSGENRIMMQKIYIYQVLMVLILPSLGLTSLDYFFRWLFNKALEIQGPIRLECVFLPNQGAFFVHYVITAAFIGNVMELIRPLGLIMYIFRMMVAKSAGERETIKQSKACEFEFGAMYARMLTVFSVIMAYSLTCPIITITGLIFMVLKHGVDRYNIYYAYLPTKLNRKIHIEAVKQTLVAPLLCLTWLFLYSLLRVGIKAPSTLLSVIVLIAIVLWALLTNFGYMKRFSPLNYKTEESSERRQLPVASEARTPDFHLNYMPHVIIDIPPEDTEQSGEHPLTEETSEQSQSTTSGEVEVNSGLQHLVDYVPSVTINIPEEPEQSEEPPLSQDTSEGNLLATGKEVVLKSPLQQQLVVYVPSVTVSIPEDPEQCAEPPFTQENSEGSHSAVSGVVVLNSCLQHLVGYVPSVTINIPEDPEQSEEPPLSQDTSEGNLLAAGREVVLKSPLQQQLVIYVPRGSINISEITEPCREPQ